MYDPVLSRNATEVLAQLFALNRRAPREAAERLDRESAGLSADLLTNLRQFGSTPTPRQLQALKLHLSLTIGGAFKLFEYSLDGMRGVEGRLNGGRTRFIESYPFYRDRPVDLPGVFGQNDAFQETAFLSDLVVRWQKGIPIRAIRGPHWRKDGFLYAQLGFNDTLAMPKVPPGSHIAIQPIGEQESRNPNPERMYFLQHGNGYICCRCAVRQHKLSIITDDRDYAGPHEFLYPGEVRIVGRLTSFGVRLPLAEPSPTLPRHLAAARNVNSIMTATYWEISYIDVETLRDGFLKSPDGKPLSLTEATAGCKQTPLWSKVPTELVLNSAYEHLAHWINDGTAAPAAPQFERNVDGTLKRDADGELVGGIRLPQLAVPTAQNSGFNSGPGTCILSGFHHEYSPAELKARYHDHAVYAREVDKATREVLKAGFILPYDAEQIRQSADASNMFLESGGDVNTDRKANGDIEIQELVRTNASWNGAAYGAYPEGVAEPVVAKITILAHKELTWHSHPMPSFAYILSGEIKVEDNKGHKAHVTAGQVMPETRCAGVRSGWESGLTTKEASPSHARVDRASY